MVFEWLGVVFSVSLSVWLELPRLWFRGREVGCRIVTCRALRFHLLWMQIVDLNVWFLWGTDSARGVLGDYRFLICVLILWVPY